jgi:RNA polymerase sigma factor (sigma-70 family)
MPGLSKKPVVRWFDTLFHEGTLGGLSDAELIERFLRPEMAGEAAFEILLGRHGPMVFGVCRRILGDDHAADDAFQATFLVLVRQAGVIRHRESLGPWLHGVARRLALRARSKARLRRERELRAAIDPAKAAVASRADDSDLGLALHSEIDRLPDRYRAPIVLCYLEGRTIAEASRQLSWPVGTVAGRLARARERLRDRLVRRGLIVPAALAALTADPACAAVVPTALARSTLSAAYQLAAGRVPSAVVSAAVANLFGQTLRTMTLARWTVGALLGVLACGAVGMNLPAASDQPEHPQPSVRTERDANTGRAAGARPLAQTLQEASLAASALTDPQDAVDAQIALAWAQIKSGDQPGARSSLDRAEHASIALEPEQRSTARVRIAQACGEAGDRQRGLDLLTLALEDANVRQPPRAWALKSIAVAQSELGDGAAARATIVALDLVLPTLEQRLRGVWTSQLYDRAEARMAVGDYDTAFGTCFAVNNPVGSDQRALSCALGQQASMLTRLASAAADSNHESRAADDPRRTMTAEELPARLALVRRAVAAVEALPEAHEHRPSLAASLAMLGAFQEARDVVRRVDQREIRQPGAVDAVWALWRIAIEQAKRGMLDEARATVRAAAVVEASPATQDKDRRQTFASGCIVAGDFDGALKAIEALGPKERAEIRSLVAKYKLRAGDRAGAEPLFRLALEDAERFRKGPLPQPELQQSPPAVYTPPKDPQAQHRAAAFMLFAMIYARAGDWTLATTSLSTIPAECREKLVAAYMIAVIRAHSGDVAGALAWARTLSSPSLRAWAIRGLASGISDEAAGQF